MARLLPPFRFGIVEKNVLRGACPTPRNFAFLRTLQLKTLISLLPSKPPAELLAFCSAHGIQALHYEVAKFKGDVTLAPNLIAELLELLIDAENHPVYVHCLDGGNNTGMVIACLRKLQNWSASVIGAEFSRFVKAKDAYISADEQDFVDAFRAAVRIPSQVPQWLWHGAAVARHPTIPLKLAHAATELVPEAPPTKQPLSRPHEAPRRALPSPDASSHALQALDMAGFDHTAPLLRASDSYVSAPSTPLHARRPAGATASPSPSPSVTPSSASSPSPQSPAPSHRTPP